MDTQPLERARTGQLGSVLVACDFTAHANDAVMRAAWLPIGRGANIALVHVLPELSPRVMGDVRSAAEALLRVTAEMVVAERERARLPAVDVFTALEVGAPAERVAARAHDERAELVVVGRGEPHGVARLLGTTAERIVRATDRSVLVVTAPPASDYLRPLITIDLSSLSQRAIAVAAEVAPVAAMNLLLVHTLPSSFAWGKVPVASETLRGWEAEEEARARQQLETWIGAQGSDLKLRPRVRRGEIAATILEEAEREKADLVVIGSRGRSRLVHLALGSVTERVLRRSLRDVLVVRTP
jgi:nucleotide-binding universal stress UspA family protein